MKRTAMMWRLRIIGITCGLGMSLCVVVIAQGPVADPHSAPVSVRELVQWLVFPVIGLAIGAVGYFGRDAYTRLKNEVDLIRSDVRTIKDDLADRYVRRDDWREEWRHFRDDWVDFKKEQGERLARLEGKLDAKADRNNGNNHG